MRSAAKLRPTQRLSASRPATAIQYAYQIALIYAVRNDRASAFKWLDRSYLQYDATPVYLRHDPLLKHLEGDPRYRDCLRKMNLPK